MTLSNPNAAFEGGTVVRQPDGSLHLFTTDTTFGIVNTSLVYYRAPSCNGTTPHFEYVGQLVCCSEGPLTGNRASLWAPMPTYDAAAARWRLFYVQYASSIPASNRSGWFYDYDGQIASAISTTPGPTGIGGPYVAADPAVVLEPDSHSESWEGLQGTDSISPPFLLPDNETWAAFYGSAQTELVPRPTDRGIWWNGLVTTRRLGAPFERRRPSSLVDFNSGGSENPIVTYLAEEGLYMAVFDDLFNESSGFGVSFSADGLDWSTPASMVEVPGGTRTPLATIVEPDGGLSIFYTAWVGASKERIFHGRFKFDGRY